jgi:hypothetical protein
MGSELLKRSLLLLLLLVVAKIRDELLHEWTLRVVVGGLRVDRVPGPLVNGREREELVGVLLARALIDHNVDDVLRELPGGVLARHGRRRLCLGDGLCACGLLQPLGVQRGLLRAAGHGVLKHHVVDVEAVKCADTMAELAECELAAPVELERADEGQVEGVGDREHGREEVGRQPEVGVEG